MRLYIVRHGETAANANNLIQGHSDVPLNAIGIQQARQLGRSLSSTSIDVAYSSDLMRAYQTCEICVQARGIPSTKDTDLRERGYGDFEGKAIGVHMSAFVSSGEEKELYRPPRGETYTEVEDRARRFLKRISSTGMGSSVLVVAHGGFNRMLLKVLMGLTFEEAFMIEQHNSCINELLYEMPRARVFRLNCTRHLAETG